MSGPGFVSGVDLPDCPPPVEVDLAHEHVPLTFLFSDEALLLPAKILVPRPEVGGADGGGALGGRIPLLASEAILDFRL